MLFHQNKKQTTFSICLDHYKKPKIHNLVLVNVRLIHTMDTVQNNQDTTKNRRTCKINPKKKKKILEKEFHHKPNQTISTMSRLQHKRPNYLIMSHLIPNLISTAFVKN